MGCQEPNSGEGKVREGEKETTTPKWRLVPKTTGAKSSY